MNIKILYSVKSLCQKKQSDLIEFNIVYDILKAICRALAGNCNI